MAPEQCTCITSISASTIDMFAVCPSASRMTSHVQVSFDVPPRVHYPVQLHFSPDGHRVTKWVAEKHFPMSLAVPFGPVPQPPAWDAAMSLAMQATEHAKGNTSPELVNVMLRDAYSAWANTMEDEVVAKTDGC